MNDALVISALNDLLTRNRDARKGYNEAANDVSDAKLRQWLFDNARKRSRMSDRLVSEIKLLGGKPNGSSSFLGAVHRVWIDFKSSVTGDDHVVLTECLRGEERALEDYNKVLDEVKLGIGTKLMLQDHRKDIEAALKSLRVLEATFMVTEA